ncbi:NAD(P)H-quinone oxidoreductase subunit U, chloroplastic [Punica granatum]|uniref:Uncharacterized protein n=2 Tax=Punica granatum TaxID=22663 RepID=A0A218XH95_PUNGR|nr:NAD(P)H-quinone oxidoreductase subunit U, chloroplastic [Punica granatum]OWM84120.1 hypothetical protein CDL15_Pgr009367 [Punica granatum]PKI34041.1 hypothetical protein CRG98_045574 [Punica granatum]
MAVSSTAAAAYNLSHGRGSTITPSLHRTHRVALVPSKSISFGERLPRRNLVASSSGDAPAAETDNAESSIEAPSSPPSLISALNVERALRGMAITDVDHYGRLGIPRKCPYDQVPVAYQKKVDEVKSQGLEEDEINKQLELLKESYSILSSVEERRMYDWSLTRSENPDRYAWPFEVDITQSPTQPPPPQEPEDVGPTRLVGYFMLGWLVLSFVLSIALNR